MESLNFSAGRRVLERLTGRKLFLKLGELAAIWTRLLSGLGMEGGGLQRGPLRRLQPNTVGISP